MKQIKIGKWIGRLVRRPPYKRFPIAVFYKGQLIEAGFEASVVRDASGVTITIPDPLRALAHDPSDTVEALVSSLTRP